VQRRRPSLYDLTDKMAALRVPTLVVTGDEDWPCLQPGLLMKQHIQTARWQSCRTAATPSTWRTPDTFNRIVGELPGPGRRRPLAEPRPACGERFDDRDALATRRFAGCGA